jgi:taurine dioxygenase
MTAVKIENLSDEFSWGSTVSGLNWDAIDDQRVRSDLNEVFEERGFLLFTGVENSAKMQAAISQIFGPLKEHPSNATPRANTDTAPGVIDMYTTPYPEDDDTGKLMFNGKKMVRWSPWHFDHCYNDELNRAGVLRVLVNAPVGGRTGFADGIELYRQLSPELRNKIEGLNVIYTLDTRLSKLRFGRPEGFKVFPEREIELAVAREALSFPRAIHPAVWTRKTGERVLHAAGWMAVGIEHHEDPEGDALLDAVCQEIRTKAHAYWHTWRPTDMVIWDNWRMLHAVEPIEPQYARHSQRSTIKGDYGLGYFEGGKKIGEVHREFVE